MGYEDVFRKQADRLLGLDDDKACLHSINVMDYNNLDDAIDYSLFLRDDLESKSIWFKVQPLFYVDDKGNLLLMDNVPEEIEREFYTDVCLSDSKTIDNDFIRKKFSTYCKHSMNFIIKKEDINKVEEFPRYLV